MRTATTPIAEALSRTLCLLLLFALAVSRVVSAQPAHVEWLKFEENGQTYLALNAYEGTAENPRLRASVSADAYPPSVSAAVHGSSTPVASPSPPAPILPPATVEGMVVEYPIRDVPKGPAVEAFLSVLERLDGTATVQSTWKPKTLEEWSHLLRVLTTRDEVWFHGRVINIREVASDLKVVYALRGHPTREHPIFPHLSRGVLAVSDFEGRPLTSFRVDFAGRASHHPIYKLVTFENLGSRPLEVYTEIDKYSPIRLSGAEITLAPRERTTRLISIEPSVFSMGKKESRALVRFASGGLEAEAFEVEAEHAGWNHLVAGTLASATTSLFGTWGAGAALPLAAAVGGVLLALFFVGIKRNSLGVTAHAIGGYSFGHMSIAIRPQPSSSGALRDRAYRIQASVRAGSIKGMAILRRITTALSTFATSGRALAEQFIQTVTWRIETVRRAWAVPVTIDGTQSAENTTVDSAASDKASALAPAANAWGRFVAWVQVLMARFAAVIAEGASVVGVTKRRLEWVQQGANMRVARVRSRTASLVRETRLHLPSLVNDARVRVSTVAQAARVHVSSVAQAARERTIPLAQVARIRTITLAQKLRALIASALELARAGMVSMATAASQAAVSLVRLIGRGGSSLARVSARTGSGIAEASRRGATTLASAVNWHTTSLARTTGPSFASLPDSARRRMAILRERAGEIMTSLREAASVKVTAAWQAALRFAAASVRKTGRVLAAVWEGVLFFWRSARSGGLSVWRYVRSSASQFRRTTREFASASWTATGFMGIWSARRERDSLQPDAGGLASLRRDNGVMSNDGAASPAVRSRSGVAFYEPLRRQASSIREGAERLADALKQDLAPSTARGERIFLRGVPQRAGNLMQTVINHVSRLATNVYLYREWTVSSIPSRDGSECVERMHRLINEMEQGSRRDAQRVLRKEAKRLASRLERDLERELVPRTTTNFQVLWALRLLRKILEHPPKNFSVAITNWLNGAERVVRSQGRDGIGPTVPEFLSYL